MRLALRVSARACGTPFVLCLSLRGRDARKLSRPEISIDTSGIAIGKQFSATSYWGNSIRRVYHLIILQAMTTAAFPLPSTGFLSEIGTKLRDWAVGQAGGSCYSRAAMSSNDSKTL